MKVHLGLFSDIPYTDDMDKLFDGIVDDKVGKSEYIQELSSRPILIIYDNDVFCGVVSMEVVPGTDYIESHILLLPDKRRLSLKVMRYIIEFTKKAGKVPMTSVSGDFPHIIKCLKILGLSVFKTEKGSIVKNGIPYDRVFMEYLK